MPPPIPVQYPLEGGLGIAMVTALQDLLRAYS